MRRRRHTFLVTSFLLLIALGITTIPAAPVSAAEGDGSGCVMAGKEPKASGAGFRKVENFVVYPPPKPGSFPKEEIKDPPVTLRVTHFKDYVCAWIGDDVGYATGNGADRPSADDWLLRWDGSKHAPSKGFTFKKTNIQKLTNGLAYLALVFCVGGMFISSALWAIGSKGQNPGQELTGKKGLILCLTAAFFVGSIPSLIGWLQTTAKTADKSGVLTASPSGLKINTGPGIVVWDTTNGCKPEQIFALAASIWGCHSRGEAHCGKDEIAVSDIGCQKVGPIYGGKILLKTSPGGTSTLIDNVSGQNNGGASDTEEAPPPDAPGSDGLYKVTDVSEKPDPRCTTEKKKYYVYAQALWGCQSAKPGKHKVVPLPTADPECAKTPHLPWYIDGKCESDLGSGDPNPYSKKKKQ